MVGLAGTALDVRAADLKAPPVVDLRTRIEALRPQPAGAPAGDHVLNPNLAPKPGEPAPREAAVLLLLTRSAHADGDLAIVLTERAAHLKAHAGQIALPGGRIEPGESATDAALREANEEVALEPDAVLVFGAVDPYLTRTGFMVTTVVGALRRDATLAPDPQEVAALFTAPWDYVMEPANHRQVVVERDGERRTYYEVMHDGRRIWGVTAGILRLVHAKVVAR